MYDLLIKGGTVVDPSQNIHGINDVAIEDGKIARIAPDIDAPESSQVVEVKGKVVTPGLIDLHTHVFAGVNSTGVEPNIGGVRAGVTTMVDAGSSGCDTFGGFPATSCPTPTPRSFASSTSAGPVLPPRPTSSARPVSISITLWRPSTRTETPSPASRPGWSRQRWRSWAWRCPGWPSVRPRRPACG